MLQKPISRGKPTHAWASTGILRTLIILIKDLKSSLAKQDKRKGKIIRCLQAPNFQASLVPQRLLCLACTTHAQDLQLGLLLGPLNHCMSSYHVAFHHSTHMQYPLQKHLQLVEQGCPDDFLPRITTFRTTSNRIQIFVKVFKQFTKNKRFYLEKYTVTD